MRVVYVDTLFFLNLAVDYFLLVLTAKVAGVDLTDRDFWRGALQMVADEVELFCKLVEE